jgi:putative ABC transport system permease protein
VEQQDPRIQRVSPTPLALTVQASLEGRAVPMRLIGGFGALALLLTAIGIYAIVAFRVAEQSRDLAIRSALGATAPHIRRLVLAHGGRLAVAGTAAGLAAFAAAAPLLPSQLYGVRALDPLSLAAAAAGVLLVGLAASFAPSRRAARSSPMELLRQL